MNEFSASRFMTVNMIYDVITTANPFHFTGKFMFIGVRNNKTEQIKS